MHRDKIRAFKNELRNYNYYLSQLVSLTNSIEYCFDRLGGVRGIDPSKEPIHSPPNKELEYKIRSDIERYEQLKTLTQAKIDYVDEILARMEIDVRMAIKSVYVEGNHIVKTSEKLFISPTGLHKRMNKAIEKALD